MHCKGCKTRETLLYPMPITELLSAATAFLLNHSECSAKMELKERNRRRYRLHAQCRKAGLIVIAKARDVQGFDDTNLPAPAQKLLNEFHYNFQHTIN